MGMIYLRLFWEFFKTGLFAVGGGMATVPFLSRMADKTGWFTQAQLTDMVAVAESTPGPIGVNTATYVGFVTGGITGSVTATLGLITPSILIILLIARFLRSYRENRIVVNALYGLRPASMGLIASALVMLLPGTFLASGAWVPAKALPGELNWLGLALAGVLLLCTRVIKKTKKVHPIVWIALSAAVGVLLGF